MMITISVVASSSNLSKLWNAFTYTESVKSMAIYLLFKKNRKFSLRMGKSSVTAYLLPRPGFMIAKEIE